eukprot:TRINITY_DN275_c0_g1_i7.p1 TRINITY_DN275_c0_g1~~TRINITY_DN275_c0_g1_i7.p1  ORF type:complete len:453 (-),score=126.61 TRINITY_DN275_c0_g1_i7:100-1458(-)
MAQARRFVPALVLGLCACLLVSLVQGPADQPSFLAAPAASRRQSTAMSGFKEDFDSWKSTLSTDEKDLLLRQAQGELNKKFRKSDDLEKDISDDKIESFGKIMQKFFDSEKEDYLKDQEAKPPNYNALKDRGNSASAFDWGLSYSVVEIDRDAERRYVFAMERMQKAKESGTTFGQSSTYSEPVIFKNDDEKSHKSNQLVVDVMKRLAAEEGASEALKKAAAEFKLPAMGQNFSQVVPKSLHETYMKAFEIYKAKVGAYRANHTEEETKKHIEDVLSKEWLEAVSGIAKNYQECVDTVAGDAAAVKKYYMTQKGREKELKDKTKADIMKEIWAELAKLTDKPMPPLDDEILAELAQEPAIIEGQFNHNWGTADKLYKSEAISPFGEKYLLGIFETMEESEKAFLAWNEEYEKAREQLKVERDQWGKQEQARVDADPDREAFTASIFAEDDED